MFLESGPARIIVDVGHNHGFAKIGGAAAGSDIGADHRPGNQFGKYRRQARRGKRIEQAAALDPEYRTGDVWQQQFDFVT